MSRPMTLADQKLAELLERPVKDTSVEELCALFSSGEKPPEKWMIGLEVELLPFLRGRPDPVPPEAISKILENLAKNQGLHAERESHGAVVGVQGEGIIVSTEPGGQIEYASRPYRQLKKLRTEVRDFCRQMNEAAQEEGIGYWAIGQQPYVDRNTATKMPKARYELMRRFMPTRGTRGLDMMHLTGSVQCAVDYKDEQNMVDKIRTAAKASPFITALTASSPFSNGKPNGYKSMRYEIWRDTDPARCGLWPEMVDAEGLTYSRYVRHALVAPAMFFLRNGEYRLPETKSFEQIAREGFEGSTVTVADFVDHLTSMFPEVRIKSYVELRGADCAPPHEAVAIAGFWRGILDDEATRRAADERLNAMTYEELIALQPAVAKLGLGAMSAAGPVHEVAEWLVDAAYDRMRNGAPDCAECLLPLVERARAGRSPADEMLEIAETTSVEDALRTVEIPPESEV